MGKEGKIRTKASTEAMRWAGDGESVIEREPGPTGNEFDIYMRDEADGVKAAKKVVDVLKARGVCIVEANAPAEVLLAANDEAMDLWEEGHFSPPLRVHNDRSMLEARLWQQALNDEEKVVWVKDSDAELLRMKPALKLLANNISSFGAGISEALRTEMGISFDRHGHAMLSCYTGDRRYGLHIDNSHGSDDHSPPDNGMRLTMAYYINTQWDPDEAGVEGGLDIYLTDPSETPSSAAAAKTSRRLRVAPHADTLVVFLSERMAHQVIATKGGDSKWFCLTQWCLNGQAMEQIPRRLKEMKQAERASSDDD